MRAPYTKSINMIVHDATGSGIGTWDDAPDSEIYGCIVYNNGLSKFEHGIYINNTTGTKNVADNIVFNNAGLNVVARGSRGADVKNITIGGNVAFNSGLLYGRDGRNISIDNAEARAVNLLSNCTYHTRGDVTDVLLNYEAPNRDIVVEGNYFTGFQRWAAASVTGNTFVPPTSIGDLHVSRLSSITPSNWDYNTYFSRNDTGRPFRLTGSASQNRDFAEWKTATRFDTNSCYTSGRPSTTDVFLRPNHYEVGRAHIIIYNWNLAASVAVDVSGVLPVGACYEVRNAQDFFAAPVCAGTYDGEPLTLPMTCLSVARPLDAAAPRQPVSTGAEFNAFVLLSY